MDVPGIGESITFTAEVVGDGYDHRGREELALVDLQDFEVEGVPIFPKDIYVPLPEMMKRPGREFVSVWDWIAERAIEYRQDQIRNER
jgi:hypothetical protein